MLKSKALNDPVRPGSSTIEAEASERSVLADLELFKEVDRDALMPIEQACRFRRFSAHEHIFEKDASSTDLFFVVRGKVRIVNYSVSGREISFADICEGDYFGEISAIDGQPCSAGAMAVDETLIMALPRRLFLALLADYPQTALRVMRRMARMLRSADERIMDLSTVAAQNRVHAELLRQAQDHQTLGNAAVIQPIPIHSDIASRVSTTRETVARVLNDLARQGIVERTRGALLIRNVRMLRSMVEEARG